MTRTCFETISRATAGESTPPGSPRYERDKRDRPAREVGGGRPKTRRGHLGIHVKAAGNRRVDLLVSAAASPRRAAGSGFS